MRHLILGLLRAGGVRHGYSLMKEYREASGRRVSIGNIYRELQRLRAGGLVRPATNPLGADPRRIPYEITDAGTAAFESWLRQPGRECIDGPEDEYSLKAFFVWKSQPHVAPQVLGEWQEQLKACHRTLSRSFCDGAPGGPGGQGPNGQALPIWHGRRLRHLAIDLQFVEELRARLEKTSAGGCREARPSAGRTSRDVGPMGKADSRARRERSRRARG